MNNSYIIKIEDLIKTYPMGLSSLTALDHINLVFKKGEFAALVGPSGSGKTTLLNIIGSLDNPTEGSVEVLGEKIENLSHKKSAQLRSKHIGFIFQTFNLLPDSRRAKLVMDALEWVGLQERAKSKPAQLSGGQSQRVAIARAMVKKPALILADEPTANLDAENSNHIMKTMEQLNREFSTTFIFATHDEKVMRYLKRKILLVDGKIDRDERLTKE
jgi:putative ABC transport system ATP-binding protein